MLKLKNNHKEDHKKVNPKAPRFYLKAIRCLGDSNFLNKFIRKYPEFKNKVTAKRMTEIVDAFNENLRKAVIDNMAGAEIPQRLGLIVMKSFPGDGDIINQPHYHQTGERVKRVTYSTDSRVMKVCYENSPSKYNFVNKNLWYFEPCRKFKTESSKAFLLDWQKYQMINREDKKIEERAEKIKMKRRMEYGLSVFLKTYDEFAF